jgi:catechol 2,3-dioxygenase-like lactoylglutathione lyase family enzyme
MPNALTIDSQITFLYYDDINAVVPFYQDILGLEPVEDQGWAKIYRVRGSAFLGIVAGDRGFHQARTENAILVTLVVDDVPAWYERLKASGLRLLSGLQDRDDIQVLCFFFEDPGGYTFEIQQFLKPELATVFHRPETAAVFYAAFCGKSPTVVSCPQPAPHELDAAFDHCLEEKMTWPDSNAWTS